MRSRTLTATGLTRSPSPFVDTIVANQMEPTVIAASIAAGVSVASVLVNFYIARMFRRTTIAALHVKATLDRADVTNKAIKEIEVEGEKLRIRCWELIGLSRNQINLD